MNPTLTLADLASLTPLLILLSGALILLLVEAFAREKGKSFLPMIALVSFVLALGAALDMPTSQSPLLNHWVRFDALAHFFNIFFLSIGLLCAGLSTSFFKRFEATRGEFFFLLLSATIGLMLIGAAADFLTLFIGFETLSIALYVLCGYMKEWKLSHESSVKYFLMGSIAAALLLYGVALIYGAVGTTRFEDLMKGYQSLNDVPYKTLFLVGVSFVTLGLAFKSAIVPFHFWAPDVYDGAPTPVTAFMAVGTKAGAFAAFSVIFLHSMPHFDLRWNQGLAWLAYPTLIYANILALRQVQLRRLFAYSGISHAGFMLIPVVVGTPEAFSALLFYLVIYAIATLGCFSVLALMESRSEGVMMHDFKGLFSKNPYLAAILSLFLLTLAGIPPTVGFIAKFYVLKVAFQSGYYFLVILGLLTAILSAFYYMRIVAIMMAEETNEGEVTVLHWPAMVVGAIMAAAIVALSVYPAPLMAFLELIAKAS